VDSTIKGFLSSRNLNTQRTESDDRIEELEAKLAVAVESLVVIDALDPDGLVNGCSNSALKCIVLRMGEIARTTLAELKGEQP